MMVQTLTLTEVKAESNDTIESTVEFENNNEYKMQRADVIVIYYRNNNGVKEYRRWNQTRAKWVDAYWMKM